MSGQKLEDHLERELKYHVRRRVAEECRKRCPDGNPMVSNITVVLGTVLAMAAFSALMGKRKPSRER